MELPGFRVYRQDFNMDPLPYWRHNDTEDRQGITEIRYIEGVYAYWDRIRATWPDACTPVSVRPAPTQCTRSSATTETASFRLCWMLGACG